MKFVADNLQPILALLTLAALAGGAVVMFRKGGLSQTVANLNDENKSWHNLYIASKAQLAESESARAKSEKQIAEWQTIAESLKATIAEKDQLRDELERRHMAEVTTLVNTIAEKDAMITVLKATISEKDALIAALKKDGHHG